MAEIEEDIEELECLDLEEMISEKNKTMKNYLYMLQIMLIKIKIRVYINQKIFIEK